RRRIGQKDVSITLERRPKKLALRGQIERPTVKWPENRVGAFAARNQSWLQRVEIPKKYTEFAARVHGGERQARAVRRHSERLPAGSALQRKSVRRLDSQFRQFRRIDQLLGMPV